MLIAACYKVEAVALIWYKAVSYGLALLLWAAASCWKLLKAAEILLAAARRHLYRLVINFNATHRPTKQSKSISRSSFFFLYLSFSLSVSLCLSRRFQFKSKRILIKWNQISQQLEIISGAWLYIDPCVSWSTLLIQKDSPPPLRLPLHPPPPFPPCESQESLDNGTASTGRKNPPPIEKKTRKERQTERRKHTWKNQTE